MARLRGTQGALVSRNIYEQKAQATCRGSSGDTFRAVGKVSFKHLCTPTELPIVIKKPEHNGFTTHIPDVTAEYSKAGRLF